VSSTPAPLKIPCVCVQGVEVTFLCVCAGVFYLLPTADDDDGVMSFPVRICKDRAMRLFERILLLLVVAPISGFVPHHHNSKTPFQVRRASTHTPSLPEEEEVDVIVIGAGVGGLSCAALTSKYGLKTLCLEAHDTAGGCAHSFSRFSSVSKETPFRFDSGPSLITGLSSKGTNPLRQVLDAIGTADDIDWKTYDGWVVHDNADGQSFKLVTGDGDEFEKALEKKAGPNARIEFAKFKKKMLEKGGLSEVSAYIPPFALRGGVSAIRSLSRYGLAFLSIGTKGMLLTGPFTKVMDLYELKDPFVRKWFDYLSFALSGLDASHTQAAPVAYMMMDIHKKGACLDYPMGGMESLIQALVSGMEKHGGELRVNSLVERVLLESSGSRAECKGVVLVDGTVIRARKGVVCNAPLWNMARILEDSVTGEEDGPVANAVKEIRNQANEMNMTGSFMHLHLGIPSDGLPNDLECHHSVLDLSKDVTAEQNLVIISIPTVFDPSLAPKGYHVIHAYTAACDSFDEWSTFLKDGVEQGKVGHSPNSIAAAAYKSLDGYKDLKEEKAEVLWRAIERVIPDVRERAKRKGSIIMSATPLTHRRYNQRFKGTYGPGPADGKDVWELAGATTKIKNLLAAGDTCYPGIGLPGVAASGTIAANSLTTVRAQTQLMKELKAKRALQ
jgi:phytoene dehydrogenase-like protein